MLFEDWHPVTCDFGLINASVSDVVEALRAWHAGIGIRYDFRTIPTSLEVSFAALAPLSQGRRRRLYLHTRSDWTACFQSGIAGSDPFPAMNMLSQLLGVLAMRVCSTPAKAVWPAVIWEVYAPEKLGGEPPLYFRRSISAANDGGRWTIFESGIPFEFEDVKAYRDKRKRKRFTQEMLQQYPVDFGLAPFNDESYAVEPISPAIILGRPPWPNQPPEFTLAEIVAGKPWQRAEDQA